MRVAVQESALLAFPDGSPVRAASGIAPFGDGWLIVQDDATHAAWSRQGVVTAVRVADPVDGLEIFSSAAGTKHRKPDFEAACAVTVDGTPGVLLLGSGSTGARMRASLVTPASFTLAELSPVYSRVAAALDIPLVQLNLEGACLVGDRLRWFQRGNAAAGIPSGSVDLDARALLAVVTGCGVADRVGVGDRRRYDLGTVGGVALAVTDALALPDGRILVSAAAEDTPNAIDDGPVVAAALALIEGETVLATAELSALPGGVPKVEGVALRDTIPGGVRLWAVVDADDPAMPSRLLALTLWW
ncbi:DUF6910 family protein [Actinoplanes regularis]|uniref:Uncharacterized protein n=1 Tax=Actinoplanes regularis TaxID=52697 RepID=A0A239IVF9_9ACTN|nr:hypothetical protein [Actinoplanes regularis]SNS96404.1 hypothetical protein SAMN06264365_13090 [Actinoplanes regularis]